MSIQQNAQADVLFYQLLQKRYFPSQSTAFKTLRDDESLRQRMDALAAAFECQVAYYPNAIYLIPEIDNQFLGFTRSDFKSHFPSSEKADLTSLRYYIILVLLLSFYDSKTSTAKIRPYMQEEELMKTVSRLLAKGAKEEEGGKIQTYTRMYQVHEALIPEDTRAANSRLNFYRRIFSFLKDQGLLIYIPEDGQIRTTQMLDDKIDFMLKSPANTRLFEALKGEEDANH